MAAVFLPEMVLYRAWDQCWAARILTHEVNKVLQARADGTTYTNPNVWNESIDHPCVGAIDPSMRKDEVGVTSDLYTGNAPARRHTDPGCVRCASSNQLGPGYENDSRLDEACPSLSHVSYDGRTRVSTDNVGVNSNEDASLNHRKGSLASLPCTNTGHIDQASLRSRGASPGMRLSSELNPTTTETDTEQIDIIEPWTFTQSLFVISGGIAINSTTFWHTPRLTLTPEGILRLAQVDLLPRISKEDVEDRSRADAFAKIVVCTQAVWFIIQCFARVSTKLPLTLLELHTMTHIACALIMYAIWFKKAYGVESPIYCEDERVINFAALLAAKGNNFLVPPTPQCSVLHDMDIEAFKYADLGPIDRRILSKHLRRANEAIRDLRERGIHYKLHRDACDGINLLTSMGVTDHTEDLSELIVEGRLDNKEDLFAPVHDRIAIALFSGLYGGNHLSAWAFHFPTVGEMWAWRACGIAMLALPILAIVLWGISLLHLYFMSWYNPEHDEARSADLWFCIQAMILIPAVAGFLYIRLFILGE